MLFVLMMSLQSINAIDSIAQIGEPLTDEQCNQLIGAIDSSDAQNVVSFRHTPASG